MKCFKSLLLIFLSISFLSLGLVKPVHATSYFNNRDVMEDENIAGAWWQKDPWIYFGGCEEDGHLACVNYRANNLYPYFSIGKPNAKQGVYQLAEPFTEHIYGKVEYQWAGKNFTATEAIVELMDHNQIETYMTTTTDKNGNYSFSPIENRRISYTVAATLKNYSGKIYVGLPRYNNSQGELKRKLRWGYVYENNIVLR